MKLFIVVRTQMADDGPLFGWSYPFKTKEEAIKKVEELHKEAIETCKDYEDDDYYDVDDTYQTGDSSYSIHMITFDNRIDFGAEIEEHEL